MPVSKNCLIGVVQVVVSEISVQTLLLLLLRACAVLLVGYNDNYVTETGEVGGARCSAPARRGCRLGLILVRTPRVLCLPAVPRLPSEEQLGRRFALDAVLHAGNQPVGRVAHLPEQVSQIA
jgi:hypothetical protein